jgi:hypothetical protein
LNARVRHAADPAVARSEREFRRKVVDDHRGLGFAEMKSVRVSFSGWRIL